MDCPFQDNCPVDGVSRPEIKRSNVLLPEPLTPTMPTIVCGATSKLIPSRARVPLAKRLAIFSSLNIEKTNIYQAGLSEKFPPCYQDGRKDPAKTGPGPKRHPHRMVGETELPVLFRKPSAESSGPSFGGSAHCYLLTTSLGKYSGSTKSATTRSISVPGSMT